MAQQRGSKAKVLIGYESTYNQAPSAGYVMPFNTCGVAGRRTLNRAETIRDSRNPAQPFAGNIDVSGPVVVPVDSTALIYWLYAMFNTPTTTGVDPYTHTFKVNDDQPSFTLEKQFADLATPKYEQLTGCRVAGFAGTVGGDGELVANISVMGAGQSMELASMDASPTTLALNRVQNFQAAITEGGGAFSDAREVSFNIDFDLDASNYVIGASGSRGDLPEGTIGVSGNIKALFKDTTLYDKALALTESSIKITVTAGASSIFEIEFPEIFYEQASPPIEGPQGLIADLNWQGFYGDDADASAVIVRVTNGVASYTF